MLRSRAWSCPPEPVSWPSIYSLFFTCRPSTILGGIGAIIVNAINRVLRRWSLPHVDKEILKYLPALTDFDSAAAITLITANIWFFAPPAEISPRRVFWCPLSSAHAVADNPHGPPRTVASARLRMSPPHIAPDCGVFFSAIAGKAPDLVPISVGTGALNSYQPAISLARCHWWEF